MENNYINMMDGVKTAQTEIQEKKLKIRSITDDENRKHITVWCQKEVFQQLVDIKLHNYYNTLVSPRSLINGCLEDLVATSILRLVNYTERGPTDLAFMQLAPVFSRMA
jgi:hypothetical protein